MPTGFASEDSPTRYRAFISYSSRDVVWARWLQRVIETYRVPGHLVGRATPGGPAPKRLRPVFRDRSELPADSDLAAKVQEALDASAFLIVVCSPAAAASRWVDEEIRRFREAHSENRILTVIVAGGPGVHQDCFPPALRYRDEEEGRVGAEPAAADLRLGGDGRRLAKLKLIAGMLGVGMDELVRRDAQRRARQFAALAAAGFMGTAAMATLAGVALVARSEAQRQRGQAEGLIEFMLTDLRKRLQPSGRLDLMDGVGKKALAYYAAQQPADLDDASLGRRASALRLMGEISLQRGDPDDGLKAFTAASATTGEIMSRKPGDGQRVFDHAQSVFWVGDVARRRGQGTEAESQFKTYLDLAGQLSRLDPGRDDWRMETAYARTALGALYMEQGRAKDAADAFTRALEVAQGIARRRPGDADDASDVIECHDWLADAFEKQGRLGETRFQRLTELGLARALLARDPTNQTASFSTVVAMRALARLSMIRGAVTAALAGYAGAAARAEVLRRTQPDDMELTGESAAAELDLGETLAAAGRLDEAAAGQRRAAELSRVALAHDPSVKEWQGYRDRARLLEAEIDGRRADHTSALAIDQAVLADLAAKPAVGINTDARWLLDRARLQTGDALSALWRPAEAHALWSAAADDLSGPLDRYEPRLLVVLRNADVRLDRQAAAKAAGRRLAALMPAPSPS